MYIFRNQCQKEKNENLIKIDSACTTMDLDSTNEISIMDISDFEIVAMSPTASPTAESTACIASSSSPSTLSYRLPRTDSTSSAATTTTTYSSSSPSPTPSSSRPSQASQSGFKTPKSTKKVYIQNYFDKTTKKEEEELNEVIARFFFGCNISLHVIESKLFKEMIKKLRPAYFKNLPCRKTLSTTLLEKEYDKQIQNIGSDSVLHIDGWKNCASNSKLVVTMIHYVSGEKSFLNAWDLSSESETSEVLADIIEKSITLAKEMYNTTVYAVVSDNASNMRKMGRLVNIWHSNCSAHVENLLIKDITNKQIAANVTTVLKEFRHPELEKLVIEKGGTKFKSPSETRWCAIRDCYVCFMSNLQFMRQVVIDSSKKIKKLLKLCYWTIYLLRQLKSRLL